jgi:hypothetical protein
MKPEEHKLKVDSIIKYLFLFFIVIIIIHYFFSSNINIDIEKISFFD